MMLVGLLVQDDFLPADLADLLSVEPDVEMRPESVADHSTGEQRGTDV